MARKKSATSPAAPLKSRGSKAPRVYLETFEEGPGGWLTIIDNFNGTKPLAVKGGVVSCYGPWWVDYNHAPPGAGYLNLLMHLNTRGPAGEREKEYGGVNRFVEGNFPHDFRNARMTLRTRGELELRGAQLVLLVQGVVDGICGGWLLTGQPIRVNKEWTEQTLDLAPDPKQWTVLGVRHDRADFYGPRPLERVLANVNVNIHLLLFPVNVVPMGPLPKGADMHRLRAGRDYPIWVSKQPDGYVQFDSVRIEFAPGA